MIVSKEDPARKGKRDEITEEDAGWSTVKSVVLILWRSASLSATTRSEEVVASFGYQSQITSHQSPFDALRLLRAGLSPFTNPLPPLTSHGRARGLVVPAALRDARKFDKIGGGGFIRFGYMTASEVGRDSQAAALSVLQAS